MEQQGKSENREMRNKYTAAGDVYKRPEQTLSRIFKDQGNHKTVQFQKDKHQVPQLECRSSGIPALVTSLCVLPHQQEIAFIRKLFFILPNNKF